MSEQHLSIDQLAGQAYDWFERKERGEDSIVTLKDGAPEWIAELVHEAHGEFMPDDWRYDVIREALGFIHDNPSVDIDDVSHEFADDVDIYTAGLLKWLGSNLRRPGYVDEATEEFGHSDDGIMRYIMRGQYMERRELFESVRSTLEAELESREDES